MMRGDRGHGLGWRWDSVAAVLRLAPPLGKRGKRAGRSLGGLARQERSPYHPTFVWDGKGLANLWRMVRIQEPKPHGVREQNFQTGNLK